jgi:general secretion pathway protein H
MRTIRSPAGFTLLELLVVLAIMGVLAGLVSVAVMPGEAARLDVESERLMQLLVLAAEEARIGGKPIAWTVQSPGYRFWQQDAQSAWTEVRGRDLFRSRTLPAGMTIAGLRVENTLARAPLRLEFAADGTSTAFAIELVSGPHRRTIAGSPIGDIAVVPPGVADAIATP